MIRKEVHYWLHCDGENCEAEIPIKSTRTLKNMTIYTGKFNNKDIKLISYKDKFYCSKCHKKIKKNKWNSSIENIESPYIELNDDCKKVLEIMKCLSKCRIFITYKTIKFYIQIQKIKFSDKILLNDKILPFHMEEQGNRTLRQLLNRLEEAGYTKYYRRRQFPFYHYSVTRLGTAYYNTMRSQQC